MAKDTSIMMQQTQWNTTKDILHVEEWKKGQMTQSSGNKFLGDLSESRELKTWDLYKPN